MAGSRLLILTALRIEQRSLLSADAIRQDDAIEFAVIGPRARRLPEKTDGVRGIMLAGLSGGLEPVLRVGDIVIDAASSMSVDSTYRRAVIHTTDQLVSTPAEKARLFATTGAAVVDMESDIVRRFASERGIPFLNLRAVSDAAGDAIDPTILSFVGDDGGTRPLAVAKALATRPTLVPELMRLRASSQIALTSLRTAFETLYSSFGLLH